jgi:hypothetical protein
MSDKGWKKGLLSSGVPLEYETARVLAQAGFTVQADYEFLRMDGASQKEFSVDTSARWYKGTDTAIHFTLDVLVECKYRSPQKTILFFSEPNEEFSSATLGGTLAAMDEFSPFHVHHEALYDCERTFDFVFKGVEVYPEGANEKDFRHGIQQLKYAAPYFIKDLFLESLSEHHDDRFPHFVARILLTNAPLRVLPEDCGIKQIEAARDIQDLGEERSAVILFGEMGPDFRTHYERIFSELDEANLDNLARRIRAENKSLGKIVHRDWHDPVQVVSSILNRGHYPHKFCTQTFVVTLAGLPKFLKEIQKACSVAYRRRRKSDKPIPWAKQR